jgi:hypothetical protein
MLQAVKSEGHLLQSLLEGALEIQCLEGRERHSRVEERLQGMRTRLVEQGWRRGASQDQSWRPRRHYLGRVVQELHLLGTARVLAMHPLRSLLIDHLLYVLSV